MTRIAFVSSVLGSAWLWLAWGVLIAAGMIALAKAPAVKRTAAGLLVAAGVVALFGILPDVPYYCDVEFWGWLCYVI